MLKRVSASRDKWRAGSWRKPRIIAAALMLLLVASGVTLPRLGLLGSSHSSTTNTPATPAPSPSRLAKEYIYAGGRLLAIEENADTTTPPPPPPPPPAPAGFSASTTAAAPATVNLTWSANATGINHYEVERKVSLTDQAPYIFNCGAPTCNDPAAAPSKVYLYRVRSIYADGTASAFSNTDLTTTFRFADDPLNSGGQRTPIKASHFGELRDAVNSVRVAVGLLEFAWTAPAPQSGGLIRAQHYNDLRMNLNEALARLNLPQTQAGPAIAGNAVTYTPVQELRDLMR